MELEKRKLILRVLCIPLMMLFILIVNMLRIPNPMMILVIPVIYFTYSDGYVNGILSGTTATVYAAYFFLAETHDPAGMAKMATIVLNVFTVILLIGKLKARDKKNLSELLRLNDSLVLAATTDKLTGSTNRQAFLEVAQAVFENSTRLQNHISVLFIDVDHFKQVNDIYGHAFGDSVLTRTSEVIAHCLRNGDLSCRYGGDEFIALLSRADCGAAQVVANRIMGEVRQARFDRHPDFRLSVSIGISSGIPTTTQNLDDLINSADENMYQAKQKGRNRIVQNQTNEP
ncbi:GGDEF domain-containing protein [Lacrimispora defluvii]|uniref:GGDEF domain-containing protein n=1 Tax=Lacrimispora defluvii TaxID=2719233 RepID=A0ABX1VQD2_9FIRM|nr:GGDEF domain-containing protein [Lacrimispora defluvii]NNJ30581.1 GGDEF domain-containing protein [Lacrimispora defluvii]